MSKAILRYKHSKYSIKGIQEQLNNVDLYKSINNNLSPEPYIQYNKLIRWGCIASFPLNEKSIVYNNRNGIKNASNKLKSRKIMEDNNVPIPQTWNDKEMPDFPCIGRPLQHFGGRNFYFCEDKIDWNNAKRKGAKYFSKYYPKTKEYRVHVASGKVIILAEKITPDNTSEQAWNLSKKGVCEEFNTLRWSEYPKDICDIAVKAVKSLGLDFGAVDIMAEPNDDSLPYAVVLEVNTAPKLGSYGQERYAEYFKFLFAHDKKVEYFNADTQRDYWFTHNQLEV
ncbi:MAG: ATP-grasp domain-containing protein [Bacillota bacterium]